MQQLQNIHIRATTPLISPRDLKAAIPSSECAIEVVAKGRQTIQAILARRDPRLLLIIGPCSIHDEQAALEYAQRLKHLSDSVTERLFIVMRVYFEKPRTIVGWKGLINDPFLNGTFDLSAGLEKARRLLLKINEIGLPAGTELLDPITPQYISDLISWASIGARTTESQTHRQMASGLSMPVGFKNATHGGFEQAVHAMAAAGHPHSFLGIDNEGRSCVLHTTGNHYSHLVLRGGTNGPNYSAQNVSAAAVALRKADLPVNIVVDCSHANSDKDYTKQAVAWKDVSCQRQAGNLDLIGMMLESNLSEGSQKLTRDLSQLKYGVSITDPCVGWEETEALVRFAHANMRGNPCTSTAGRGS